MDAADFGLARQQRARYRNRPKEHSDGRLMVLARCLAE
jgi:hypothetical protein